jgi:hypothetical protein
MEESMRFVTGILFCATLAFSLAGFAGGATADPTVEEYFLCTLNDGKDMGDVMKVVEEWKPVISQMKGGNSYKAKILTPFASDNMDMIIWVGRMPSMASYGALTDEYGSAKAGQDIDAKFNEVLTCNSHSIWLVRNVR